VCDLMVGVQAMGTHQQPLLCMLPLRRSCLLGPSHLTTRHHSNSLQESAACSFPASCCSCVVLAGLFLHNVCSLLFNLRNTHSSRA
jgi:hypothetical protein